MTDGLDIDSDLGAAADIDQITAGAMDVHQPEPGGHATSAPERRRNPSGYRNLSRPYDARKDTSPVDRAMSRRQFDELRVEYDSERKILWSIMNPAERPCFTPGLLREIRAAQSAVRQGVADAGEGADPIRYVVVASAIPGIFNMGGHLELFADLVERRDDVALRQYARQCIDCVYAHATHLDLPISTISLVQGDALGGGFEQALSSDIIIAEKKAKFGLPEILFGLFPGMGAYSFLARRVGGAVAERMIKSGRIYSAEELHEMGLVDVVADDDFGREALVEYVERNERRFHAHQAVYRTRNIVSPVTYEELADVTEVWVDAALKLSPADLRKMRRLATAQARRHSPAGNQPSQTG